MDIKNRQELAKIITLCRKNGINHFKDTVSGIEFTLSQTQPRARRRLKDVDLDIQTPDFVDQLTPEDRMFWSSAGIPEEKAAV